MGTGGEKCTQTYKCGLVRALHNDLSPALSLIMTALFRLRHTSNVYSVCDQPILASLSSLQSFTDDVPVYRVTYLLQYMILLGYDLHSSHLADYNALILLGTDDASQICITSTFN